jgi:hypothetical protein
MSESLRFSLTPSISEIYDRIRPTSHIVEKGVIWLRDGRNSLVLKITLLALSIVATLGISTIGSYLLLTSPLLGKSLVFLPSFLWAGLFIVNSLLSHKVEKEKIQLCFESVQNVVGGPEAFSSIPEFNVDNLVGEEGDVSENLIKEAFQKNGFWVLPRLLKPEHFLTGPLMKGEDYRGRRFVSFKLLDKDDRSSEPFVRTLCETSRTSFLFDWVILPSTERPADSALTLNELHQIVVTNNHPKYALAR